MNLIMQKSLIQNATKNVRVMVQKNVVDSEPWEFMRQELNVKIQNLYLINIDIASCIPLQNFWLPEKVK